MRGIARVLLAALMLSPHAFAKISMTDTDPSKVFTDATVAALARAAGDGDTEHVRTLVAAGANPNAHGDKGVTLLEWALLEQSPTGMAALLEAGADPAQPGIGGATVLHMAAMADDPVYLKTLLEHHANPDTPHGVTRAPPLSAALMNPDDATFSLLLAHHADPNVADRLGNTPLHVAAKVHKPKAILALLQAGADATRTNSTHATFQVYFNIAPAGGYSAAAKADRDAVLDWLRDHGVAIEQGTR